MKHFKFLMIGLLAVSLATATSCNKEVQGPQGPKGDNGNANVVSKTDYKVYTADWVKNTPNNLWSADIYVADITADIVKNGLVQVYEVNSDIIVPLPYTLVGESMLFAFTNGKITIFNNYISGTTPNPGAKTFRVVIIPSSGLITHPNVDYTNYDEIAKAFNLD